MSDTVTLRREDVRKLAAKIYAITDVVMATSSEFLSAIEQAILDAAIKVPSEWLPIATAPRDGTIIIGLCAGSAGDVAGKIDFARWDDDRWIDPSTHTIALTHWLPNPTAKPHPAPAVPSEHPEATCERCRCPNVRRWHAPSPLWNAVMRSDGADAYGIVCPVCFAELAEARGVTVESWCFRPHGLDVASLWVDGDGRRWDPDQCLWVDAASEPQETPTTPLDIEALAEEIITEFRHELLRYRMLSDVKKQLLAILQRATGRKS